MSNMKVANMKAILVTLCALLLVAGAFAQQLASRKQHETTPRSHRVPRTRPTALPASLPATFAMSLVLFRTQKRVRQPHRWQRTAWKNVSAEARPS